MKPSTPSMREWLLAGAGIAAGLAVGNHFCTRRKKVKGLKEFSVVYTDRALNLMSEEFKQVMRDINDTLKEAYNAKHVALIPGSGSFAMEACARQFALGQKVVVIRNGYFSYRWSDIFERSNIPKKETVLKAKEAEDTGETPHYAPMDIKEIVQKILAEKPAAVFAPHVETATGIILPDEWLKQISDAVHKVGGIFVLDCIASGTVWVDMEECGVDALISAPQKGWSGPACCGLVMLSERGYDRVHKGDRDADTLVTNLRMWSTVMDVYEKGGFKYYTTLPTDALRTFRDVMQETKNYGFDKSREDLWKMGNEVRKRFAEMGFKSVAAPGFQAPGVVVVYAPPQLRGTNVAGKFKEQGIQIAGGVPWKIGEPEGRGPKTTFRIGLFGLDKISNIPHSVNSLFAAVAKIN